MADQQQPPFVFVPYQYAVTTSSMNGGASQIQPLVLDQDADFELHEITAATSNGAATDIRPNFFSVQVTDKNNSHILSNQRIQQVDFMPRMRLTRPVLFAKRSNLNFDFLNLTAGTALTATITFHGFKVYPNG